METRTRMLVVLLTGIALTTGCDSSTGADTGRIDAVAVDHPAASPAPAAEADSAPAGAPTEGEESAWTGSLSGTVQVSVWADDSAWVDLAPPRAVVISMQSGDEITLHGVVVCPVGTYARVRVRFRDARASIAAGGTVGGVVLTNAAFIQLGGSDDEVVVEKTVTPFQVRADATTRIRFNLNTAAWVTMQSIQAQSTADAAIQSAVSATVQ